MRVLTISVLSLSLLAPLLAGAQGSITPDPNAMPQGRTGQTRAADPQLNAEAAYREAQARCRGVTPARQKQDCVRQAMAQYDHAPRRRTPSVTVRPASAASAASGAASR